MFSFPIGLPLIQFYLRFLDNEKFGSVSLVSSNKLEAHNALIIGEDEINNKKVQLKDLNTREQKEIKFEDLKIFIRDKYYKLKDQKHD